jgi:Na+/melibiose symporter-like transporter
MKSLSKGKTWLFAIGQFGWALLSGLIGSWLVYFYQPDATSIQAGQTVFIPQGRVFLGVLTIIGVITAFGRIFDAITDPLVASMSDNCKSPLGRRIPFLKWFALPFAIVTVLVFCAPINHISALNAVWLFVLIAAYYMAITLYCTPYTALYSEITHTESERMYASTAISLTFIAGTAVAYCAPTIWNALTPTFGRVASMRIAFAILAIVSLVCLYVPVFTINEKDYVDSVPVQGNMFQSLGKTFKNKNFRIFVGSDIFYWIGLTMFQTGLPYFVTALLGLPESYFMPMFVGMTACSLLFYVPINFATKKLGKKNMVLIAFALFTITFAYTAITGKISFISPTVQAIILVIMGSIPMAIFGILPQAMVADCAEYDSKLTGESRQGMFFAARTFCFKLGQSLAMLIFTSLATIGNTTVNGITTSTGAGYRIVAITAAVLCCIGGIILTFFNEKIFKQTPSTAK